MARQPFIEFTFERAIKTREIQNPYPLFRINPKCLPKSVVKNYHLDTWTIIRSFCRRIPETRWGASSPLCFLRHEEQSVVQQKWQDVILNVISDAFKQKIRADTFTCAKSAAKLRLEASFRTTVLTKETINSFPVFADEILFAKVLEMRSRRLRRWVQFHNPALLVDRLSGISKCKGPGILEVIRKSDISRPQLDQNRALPTPQSPAQPLLRAAQTRSASAQSRLRSKQRSLRSGNGTGTW
jgi:hypothetical protein